MTAESPQHPAAPTGGDAERARLSDTGLDDLLRELLGRVQGVLDEQARWRLLLDAVVTMGADLSLDRLLSRIVAIAGDLAGAQYAALGVLGPGPDRLRTFITHGLSQTQVNEIGDLPTGHGLLGLIIDRPEPLRLHDIAEHPASYGFPPGHPPMKSFLGVPVRIRDRVFGNLYLTEKVGGGDFTEQDEAIVVALAAADDVAGQRRGQIQRSHRDRVSGRSGDHLEAETVRLRAGHDPRHVGVRHLATLYADTLVVAHEVRLDRRVDDEAFGFEDRAQVGASRTLAVGPGDVEHRRQPLLRIAEQREQLVDRVEPEPALRQRQRGQPIELCLDHGILGGGEILQSALPRLEGRFGSRAADCACPALRRTARFSL